MLNKGILTKGSKVSYALYTDADMTTHGALTEITNCTKIPSLGGDVEKVEVTTLMDGSHQYIPGLVDYGDLEFEFLYDAEETTSNYRVIKALNEQIVYVEVELGDKPKTGGVSGSKFSFAAILTASLNEATPGEALKFNMKAALQSDIAFEEPK